MLGLAQAAPLIRYTRSSMLEAIRQDYVRVARAKGLSERKVISRHALRNALIPLVTVVALSLPQLLGGTVIIEQIFAWPGMGTLAIKAVRARDYPTIMAINLIGAVLDPGQQPDRRCDLRVDRSAHQVLLMAMTGEPGLGSSRDCRTVRQRPRRLSRRAPGERVRRASLPDASASRQRSDRLAAVPAPPAGDDRRWRFCCADLRVGLRAVDHQP